MSSLPRHLLPELFAQIADYCGDEVMLAVWEHYGGGHLHVPLLENLTPAHHLAVAIGYHNARLLCEAFGGETINNVPNGAAGANKLRKLAIVADRKTMTPMQIARKYKLTERRIYMILAEQPPESMNFDLFED